ncbi:MAG: glycosyltransferase, partial [Verrucomicrobiaceae bacterium]
GVKVLFFEPPPAQRVGGLDAAITTLRTALQELGVEVNDQLSRSTLTDDVYAVHFHGLWQPGHIRIANECRRRGIPFVVSPHGMLEPWAWRHKAWKKWPYYYLVERRFLRSASCVLATANSEAERLSELLPGQRIETLPLGMTADVGPDYSAARECTGWSPNELVLLFLSRIHVKKGLDLLLRALCEMPVPADVRLVVVGGGEQSYVATLKSFVQQNAPRLPRIDWLGEIWGDERWKYFQGADLFCLPTHSENFGLAVLEALQVGTPVLTTRTTPWVAYLNAERGLLADPTVESLKSSLSTFLSAPRSSALSREQTAAWAHETFSWSQLAPRYRSLYESLVPIRSGAL